MVCLLFIMVVSGSLRQISGELPRYGFYAIRELHIMLRDIAVLGDVAATARLAPDNPESLERLSEANDLAYIRFVRLDRTETIDNFPEYASLIERIAKQVEAIDDVVAKGLPLDPTILQAAETQLVEIEEIMNEYYYSFGADTNAALITLQNTMDKLSWQVIASLFALSLASIGSALLLVNRHQVLGAVKYLASHDQTTGVHNRNWMSLHGDLYLKEAHRKNHSISVALIDLDHFKEINDTFGHHVGDQVLQAVGETLLKVAEKPNIKAFRVGGDEFALIVSCSDGEDPHAIFQALSASLNQHFGVETHRLRIGASIGTASFPDDGKDLDTLLKNADHAVYAAKAQGRGRVVRFSSEILSQINSLSRIESRLQSALRGEELFLVWQPQFRLATGQITGLEALVRWRDPKSGEFISPSDFIPIAERNDLILEIDRYVLKKACSHASELLAYSPDLTFSVNLSGKSFQDPGLPAYIRTVLNSSGLAPRNLEIEITESVFIGNRIAADKVFAKLIDLGVKFAVDDFGTGYSNFASLAELPLDRIKIDRSFIKGVETQEKKRKLVLSILALARSLDIDVVAEGIESKEQMSLLIDNNCEFAQGFYLSRPLDRDSLVKFLIQMKGSQDGEFRDSA